MMRATSAIFLFDSPCQLVLTPKVGPARVRVLGDNSGLWKEAEDEAETIQCGADCVYVYDLPPLTRPTIYKSQAARKGQEVFDERTEKRWRIGRARRS